MYALKAKAKAPIKIAAGLVAIINSSNVLVTLGSTRGTLGNYLRDEKLEITLFKRQRRRPMQAASGSHALTYFAHRRERVNFGD